MGIANRAGSQFQVLSRLRLDEHRPFMLLITDAKRVRCEYSSLD